MYNNTPNDFSRNPHNQSDQYQNNQNNFHSSHSSYPDSQYQEASYQEPAYQQSSYQEAPYREPAYQEAPYRDPAQSAYHIPQPNYHEPEHPQPSQPYNLNGYYTHEVSPQLTGKMATASFVLGLIGFFTGFFLVGLILDVLAIIFAVITLTTGRPKRSMAKLGLFLGVVSILLTLGSYALIGNYMNQPYQHEPYVATAAEQTTSDELMSNISYEVHDTAGGVLLIVDNSNEVDVDLDVNVTYFDEKGDMISLSADYIWGCAAGGRSALRLSPPYNKKYEDIPYADYEISFLASTTDMNYYSQNLARYLEIQSNISASDTVIASITNTSGHTLDNVDLVCVFYQDGIPVGTSTEYITELGKKDTVEFYSPYDKEYNEIPFDDYEIVVNTAQYYLN